MDQVTMQDIESSVILMPPTSQHSITLSFLPEMFSPQVNINTLILAPNLWLEMFPPQANTNI